MRIYDLGGMLFPYYSQTPYFFIVFVYSFFVLENPFSHQDQCQDKAKIDFLRLSLFFQPFEKGHQHLVVNEQLLLLARLGQPGFPVTKNIRLPALPIIGAEIPPLQSILSLDQSSEVFFAIFYFSFCAVALPKRLFNFPFIHITVFLLYLIESLFETYLTVFS